MKSVKCPTADAMVHRVYRDLGYEIHVWVIFWSSRNMVKEAITTPTCAGRIAGFGPENRERDSGPRPPAAAHSPLPCVNSARLGPARRFLYWTRRAAPRLVGRRRDLAFKRPEYSHDWLGERLFQRDQPAQPGESLAPVGTAVWGDNSSIRTQTLGFTAKLADEVYRVCPWAAPPD